MLRKLILYIFCFGLNLQLVYGQIYAKNIAVNPDLLNKWWQAYWITHPTESVKDCNVFHFRRTFDLQLKPEQFIIHISADNRYRLFVNGHPICHGPARGDIGHWRFETVDISDYLKAGKNCLAVVVWNFGEHIPLAQITWQTALIVQGNSRQESIVNTNQNWKVIKNTAFQPIPTNQSTLKTYIVVGPGEQIEGSEYPWDWEKLDYDDSQWMKVRVLHNGLPRGTGTDGSWMLTPRMIPLLENSLIRLQKVRRTTGIEVSNKFLTAEKELIIPANSSVTVLLDQTFLTTAYPELLLSGGKGSEIVLTYSEALFDENRTKGNRNEIEGRRIIGYSDKFIADGGSHRLFRTLWFRTYRYLELKIATKSEPLTIHDLRGEFTAYPFEEKAFFKSDSEALSKIWDIGWRTARLCANETYFDCPYYEQLQYVGDTRIQALISLYVSGDDRLMRKAIQVFDDSRISDGLTQSRYPCSSMQIIPPYSLFWIAMIHDYWMHRDDPEFIKSFLPGIQSVLDWHLKLIDDSGMTVHKAWWNYVDWTKEWPWNNDTRVGGVPSLDKSGHSSILSLQIVYCLRYGAELMAAFGQQHLATYYHESEEKIKNSVYKHCWHESRQLIADTPDKKVFSQHANLLAVLTELIPTEKQQNFMTKIADDKNIIQCTMYYRFYLQQAMKKANLGDRYIDMLEPWYNMLKLGLTTFAERPEPSRSDCHAWSASPNYEFLATICGIVPDSPGFKTVRIEPHLGTLKSVAGSVPHPLGNVVVDFKRKGKHGIRGNITLPEGLTGKFVWKDKSVELKSGKQKIEF